MTVSLEATKRTLTGKGVSTLRDGGGMPGVVYGPKQAAMAIEVSLRDFSKTLEAAGESTVVQLMIDGAEHNVLIHDIDRDPVTGTPRHADFYAIVKGQKVQVAVPIEFMGVAPAVKELNANLVKALHELEVEADPMDLPHELIVDVSGLDVLNKQILAGDVALPFGVTLMTRAEEVIATVVEAVEEKVEEVVVAPDMEAIGISEERGKKEEEGAEKSATPATPEA
ncbi:50S ribosomal protein L25 [Candidatus Kaiserbacteria bacterium]|nr:50S ribosomal protein L25 [Candidatus Kaiserbacteria bacterium]